MTDRGKSLGLYHYAGGNNAASEADYFVAKARDYVGRAVLVLDWESYQNAQWGNSDWVRRFVQRVHTLTGVWPMVYVQASAIRQIPSDVRANCGLWVAQYASNAPTGYQSRPWNYSIYGEAMRQYTSNGWVNGYNGPLDLNYFRGDAGQWQAYANPAGKAQTTTPPQVETPRPRPSIYRPSPPPRSVATTATASSDATRSARTTTRSWRSSTNASMAPPPSCSSRRPPPRASPSALATP